MSDMLLKIFNDFLKRVFDIFFSFVGLIIFSPFLLVLSFIIKFDSPGPVFYRGMRIGKDGKPFKICKFRTMVVNADEIGGSSTSGDDPRITGVGKFLRRYKLDELPQLFDILRGKMSFVGPRPQVEWAVNLYSEEEKKILSMRPGITDWASLWNFHEEELLRGSENPDKDYMEKIHPKKMELSLEYIKHNSFWIDLKIILKTIIKIFSKYNNYEN